MDSEEQNTTPSKVDKISEEQNTTPSDDDLKQYDIFLSHSNSSRDKAFELFLKTVVSISTVFLITGLPLFSGTFDFKKTSENWLILYSAFLFAASIASVVLFLFLSALAHVRNEQRYYDYLFKNGKHTIKKYVMLIFFFYLPMCAFMVAVFFMMLFVSFNFNNLKG